MKAKRIVLFASGKGSNVQAILDYFRGREEVCFVHLYCNKKEAGVLDIANREGIAYTLIADRELFQAAYWLTDLQALQPDLLVLAGFLWKIPEAVVKAYPHQIINLHPALLPSFGGKGMYGHRVHEAVLQSKSKISGITIHEVNAQYDEGDILLQATCEVKNDDTPDTLAHRIHQLEHYHLPRVMDQLLFS